MFLEELKTINFFNIDEDDPFYEFFSDAEFPWQLLGRISQFIKAVGAALTPENFRKIGDDIWIENTAVVSEFSSIKGPAIIDAGAELRPGCFIRGNVFVGRGTVVGNSTEIKNALLLGHVDVPHYNYIGDSILAYGAHMGAGSITSNLRADKQNIVVRYGENEIHTGLRKFGAMVAQSVEVGCNAVLNPGVMVGERSIVYPLTSVRVSIPPHYIYKQTGEMVRNRNFE